MTKIYIETAGCSLNQSDSEVMAGLLKKADFDIVDSLESCDLVILNTCTVKGPTEAKFWKRLEEIRDLNRKIIIAGCIAQTEPERLSEFSLIGTTQINNIVSVVEETINDNTVKLIAFEKNPRLNLPHIRRNSAVEIIPICSGCLGEPCAYCKVKEARGELVSYDKDEILKQISKATLHGAKEIWLTSQDNGCWGKDINSSFPELLREIIELSGNFKVRVGMMNPNHAKEFLDELIDVMKNDKCFKFLHLPVQSGNNDILKIMRRKYTVEDFKEIIEKIRKEIPDITIATDIIVGFPGESEEQFQDSIKLIREVKPDVLNRSRFWPRPGTEAAEMEGQIHGQETKRRCTILVDVFNIMARVKNEKWIGWKGDILIDEKGKDDTWVGRNYAYRPVIVRGNLSLGDKVKVKVEKVNEHDLRGILIH
ncbi:tRNA (N(6)-L-threonylcarbamoyladenosine(37)-C(2))-methylthiotransferase [Candidatus Woesearchaeota archaeon]|nr:tRNA (N(6)-L-threonylcarbamoyladenosine(37)-C(2))-methylthiotransferase [Candidatus Woesearchaeota archaeon]